MVVPQVIQNTRWCAGLFVFSETLVNKALFGGTFFEAEMLVRDGMEKEET